jgi:dienelactone hydrolase
LASDSVKSKELLSSGVSFYPWCWYYVKPDKSWPLQLHVGTADEWNPAATCIRNEKRQRETLEFFMYEGAHHGWDIDGANYTILGSDGKTVSPKTIKFDYDSNKLSRQRTKIWFDRHFNLDM